MKTVDECKTWWENQAKNIYFKNQHWYFSVPELIQLMGLTSDSEILEIGCGYGREMSQFAKISSHIYGIDIAKTHAELTKKNVPQAETKEYNGTDIPYQDNSFDFIYTAYVMQHMSKENCRKLMREMNRCLKPKGKILLEFFGGIREAGEDKDMMLGDMYNNGFTSEEIIKLSTDAGFKWQFIHTKNYEQVDPGIKNLWLYAIKP